MSLTLIATESPASCKYSTQVRRCRPGEPGIIAKRVGTGLKQRLAVGVRPDIGSIVPGGSRQQAARGMRVLERQIFCGVHDGSRLSDDARLFRGDLSRIFREPQMRLRTSSEFALCARQQ
jgi:hypothetical protein